MRTQRLQSLLVALVAVVMAATAAHATDAVSPIGFWKGQDAIFEMFENDGKLSARIVALSEPKTSEGKEKTDIHNPDSTKRGDPIIGLVFIRGFVKKSDTRWEHGTIYDPKKWQHLFLCNGPAGTRQDHGPRICRYRTAWQKLHLDPS